LPAFSFLAITLLVHGILVLPNQPLLKVWEKCDSMIARPWQAAQFSFATALEKCLDTREIISNTPQLFPQVLGGFHPKQVV
jgi:hypothetical protein